MRILFSFLLLCIASFINGISFDWIEIEDDGPVVTDGSITFTVNNKYRADDPSFEYRFKFDQFPQHDKNIVSTSRSIKYSVTFESSSTPKAGNYTMQVDVWFIGVPSRLIATALHDFQLLDKLVGFINSENFIKDAISGRNFVATARPVKLTAEIRDPTGFFMRRSGIVPANITYKWIINDEVQEERSKVIERTFSQPQLNNISVIVTATKTNGSRLIQKSDSFSTTLQSRNIITNLTVDGPTEVKMFEKHQLDFKIHGGTPPFHYRYHLTMENPYIETENVKKDTNESFFSIVNYFSEKGTRDLYIVITDEVSKISHGFNISVY